MGIYNRAAFMLTLLKDKLWGGRSPLVTVINTTFRCNLRCNYCYGRFFDRHTPDLPTADLLALITELGRMGTRMVTLTGGEPLLREDIGILIDQVKKHGMECGFNTNGILIPKKLAELKRADMICISLDGPREFNDLNRGNGTFERTLAGLKAAQAAGIKIHINAVLTRHNYHCVDWIVDFARQQNVQAEFNFLYEQSGNLDELRISDEHLRQAAKRIAELKSQGAPILFSDAVYHYVAAWPDYGRHMFRGDKPPFPYLPCYAGRFIMVIDADGKVYPCFQLMGSFQALDFREVGIRRAWENCAKHGCHTCYFPCFNEYNNIFSLNPRVILHQVASTLKGH